MAEKSVDDRALDVATQVLHHIDTMYPGMWKGVPASARTSLWNTIISAVNVRFRPAVETTSAPSAAGALTGGPSSEGPLPAAVGADRKCNTCDGTGLKHRGMMHRNVDTECSACGGTGRVTVETPEGRPWYLYHQWGQDNDYKWYQSCHCRKCADSTAAIAKAQERATLLAEKATGEQT